MSEKELIRACIAPLMAVLDASGPPGMDRTSVTPDFVRLILGETRPLSPCPSTPPSAVSECRRHTELFVRPDRFAAGKQKEGRKGTILLASRHLRHDDLCLDCAGVGKGPPAMLAENERGG
jgi:hypothetical protein